MRECALCRKDLGPEMSEEERKEAEEELKKNFPGSSVRDCAVVCDDCYDKLMKGE